MAKDWAYARITDRNNRDLGPNVNALRHASGNWQIAKYPSEPIYCLFDMRSGKAVLANCGNDLDALKGMAK
jgi:hypothetical protein